MTDPQIWRWTLTKESIAPCFVRDVLAMRQSNDKDTDFFWLGRTPCRTVLLVGMVVAIQVYDKRAIYTIDDGTAVIDCVLRHPNPTIAATSRRSPPRSTGCPNAKPNPQRSSPKKPRLDKAKLESMEPPPPITEPGYPVRVVGKVIRHYESRQIYADTIDPCSSSLDEIAHLEHVIELHKTKYSLAIPFVLPPKPSSCTTPPDMPTSHAGVDAGASVFSNPSATSRPGPSTTSYALPAPPRMPMPLQNRNRPPSVSMHVQPTYHGHTHAPSSPTASSIASSTPSSPCKSSSPVKVHEDPPKPKLRHPSRLHTRDLTANTFRLYVKHYMDNAPPPLPPPWPSPSQSTCGGLETPRKRDNDEGDEVTPRPRPNGRNETRDRDEGKDRATLGFTLSHLRRVPELALLAARVVRAETRKRDKAEREKERANSRTPLPASTVLGRPNGYENGNKSGPIPRNGAAADPPRKKMARLFSWAVVKLYEEGGIVLWDGDIRPLPVLLAPLVLPLQSNGLWNDDTRSSVPEAPSVSYCASSTLADSNMSTSSSASALYNLSASAPLYSHYHPPRRPSGNKHPQHDEGSGDMNAIDADADPTYLSDPPTDEEAYVPLTPRLLAGYVKEAVAALRRRGTGAKAGPRGGRDDGRKGREPTPEEVLTYLHRIDGRWARVGVWAVEEALHVLKE